MADYATYHPYVRVLRRPLGKPFPHGVPLGTTGVHTYSAASRLLDLEFPSKYEFVHLERPIWMKYLPIDVLRRAEIARLKSKRRLDAQDFGMLPYNSWSTYLKPSRVIPRYYINDNRDYYIGDYYPIVVSRYPVRPLRMAQLAPLSVRAIPIEDSSLDALTLDIETEEKRIQAQHEAKRIQSAIWQSEATERAIKLCKDRNRIRNQLRRIDNARMLAPIYSSPGVETLGTRHKVLINYHKGAAATAQQDSTRHTDDVTAARRPLTDYKDEGIDDITVKLSKTPAHAVITNGFADEQEATLKIAEEEPQASFSVAEQQVEPADEPSKKASQVVEPSEDEILQEPKSKSKKEYKYEKSKDKTKKHDKKALKTEEKPESVTEYTPKKERKTEPVVAEQEAKIEPVKEEKKAEPVKEEKKAEPVVEEKKVEPVKEEVEPVVEEKKVEPVKEEVEPVVEEKKVEPVVEEEKVEPTIEEKKVEPVIEEKKVEPVIEEKKVEPVIEEKKVEPVIEDKKVESVVADEEEYITFIAEKTKDLPDVQEDKVTEPPEPAVEPLEEQQQLIEEPLVSEPADEPIASEVPVEEPLKSNVDYVLVEEPEEAIPVSKVPDASVVDQQPTDAVDLEEKSSPTTHTEPQPELHAVEVEHEETEPISKVQNEPVELETVMESPLPIKSQISTDETSEPHHFEPDTVVEEAAPVAAVEEPAVSAEIEIETESSFTVTTNKRSYSSRFSVEEETSKKAEVSTEATKDNVEEEPQSPTVLRRLVSNVSAFEGDACDPSEWDDDDKAPLPSPKIEPSKKIILSASDDAIPAHNRSYQDEDSPSAIITEEPSTTEDSNVEPHIEEPDDETEKYDDNE